MFFFSIIAHLNIIDIIDMVQHSSRIKIRLDIKQKLSYEQDQTNPHYCEQYCSNLNVNILCIMYNVKG
jgi:hypothetical protein